MSRQKTIQPEQIYELKITLKNSKPSIWRKVAVSGDTRLDVLHEIIQIVMGWTNSHLHQFIVQDQRPKPDADEICSLARTNQWDKLATRMQRGRYFSHPEAELDNAEDESKVKLSELAPAVKSKFVYEYDFGDGWDHSIEVIKINAPVEGVKYPVCLAGKLACPPDDCGGIWGYYDMLEVLKDPKHERYEELSEWIGNDFDPERFDIDEINAALAKELK